jgi:hypothetical protein
MQPNLTELPDGFVRISGKRKPPVGWRGYIALRCGFVDTRVVYEREQLVWQHDGGPGDIVAVMTLEGE